MTITASFNCCDQDRRTSTTSIAIIIIITTTTVVTYQLVPDYITNPLIITFVNAGLTQIRVTQFLLPFSSLTGALLTIKMSFFGPKLQI
jgi:hypothetical protein